MQKHLSIIVPVYKIEKYIRPCFESIFQQGLSDDIYEIIVVNDGTPDHSMEVVADLLEQHNNITIINQENQGLSVARNTALACATGEYILMLDSDDLLVENSLPLILKKAINSKADIVMADFLKMEEEELRMPIHLPAPKGIEWKEKTGKQFFVEELNPRECYVWRSVYRREFLQSHHIQFVPGIYYQDVPFTHECYLYAQKCLRTKLLLTIYRQRSDSTQAHYTMKHARDFSIAIGKTWLLRKNEGISPGEYRKLQADVFCSFYSMMRTTLYFMPSFNDRLHTMQFLAENAPDLRFTDGRTQKMISFLYHLSPYLLMSVLSLRWKWHHRKTAQN